MKFSQKLLSGLLVSGLISVGGGMALKAIAHETEAIVQTPIQKNLDEYAQTCAKWQGQLSKFSRRHTTNYGWFDFSDSRWIGLPVKEVDFWYACMRNTFHFEAGEEASRKDLGEMCDRIGENFQKNWVYFPQFSSVTHEFQTETIGQHFHLYTCRIVVRPQLTIDN